MSFLSVVRSLFIKHTHNQWQYSLLRQKDTWNRIQITLGGLEALISSFKVFPEFWAFVKGFGLKFEPEDEYVIDHKSLFHYKVRSS